MHVVVCVVSRAEEMALEPEGDGVSEDHVDPAAAAAAMPAAAAAAYVLDQPSLVNWLVRPTNQ